MSAREPDYPPQISAAMWLIALCVRTHEQWPARREITDADLLACRSAALKALADYFPTFAERGVEDQSAEIDTAVASDKSQEKFGPSELHRLSEAGANQLQKTKRSVVRTSAATGEQDAPKK